jgi:hypothetical protein
MLEDDEIFHGFCYSEHRAILPSVCHNWWYRKYENKTPTIGGLFQLKNEFQVFFLSYVLYISVGDEKGILSTISATLLLN